MKEGTLANCTWKIDPTKPDVQVGDVAETLAENLCKGSKSLLLESNPRLQPSYFHCQRNFVLKQETEETFCRRITITQLKSDTKANQPSLRVFPPSSGFLNLYFLSDSQAMPVRSRSTFLSWLSCGSVNKISIESGMNIITDRLRFWPMRSRWEALLWSSRCSAITLWCEPERHRH